MEPTTEASSPFLAGTARVEITNTAAGPCNDPLYVKALVLRAGATTVVIVTVDAVAIAEIGTIRNDYLAKVRAQLQQELNIDPACVLINASHCHGVVCDDVDLRTVQAVKAAAQAMVPVTVGVGTGHEARIMENRRLKLKNGREADVRHAYSLPPDAEVESVGVVDPEIGVLRLDRQNGDPLAVVYNFACHPIQGVPNGGNTADITGFASKTIEDMLGDGAMAFFLQGCAGDVNPIWYKDVDHPRDAEPLGTMLGLSALQAAKQISCRGGGALQLVHETVELPRADLTPYIESLRTEENRLLQSLQGTSLNLKTFLRLIVKYNLAGDFPSYDSHRYLHDRAMGQDDLDRLDATNRQHIARYVENIHVMEQLTRVQTNLSLLKMHQAQNSDSFRVRVAAGSETISVEVSALRVGDFVLVTFPGELSVEIGMNIKQRSPHRFTFVAAYTNGYIYYAPTAAQLRNRGGAQEDSDCLLAPEWQQLYEDKVAEMLAQL